MRDGKYSCFEVRPLPRRQYAVRTLDNRELLLGVIKPHGPWSFGFWPSEGMVFSKECLADLLSAVDDIEDLHNMPGQIGTRP